MIAADEDTVRTPTRRRSAGLLRFAIGALVAAACRASDAPSTPLAVTDDWSRADAAAAGFAAGALEQLAADIAAGAFPNTHALLVEHDGSLVFERYFGGSDERWGEPIPSRAMGPDSLHDLRSASKSVTSILLGIALSREVEEAVTRPMAEYLPSLAQLPDAGRITLHQVLTMTTGLRWNEMTVPYTDSTNDEIRLYRETDPALAVMSRPRVQEPGSTWYYSGGSTQVLATVISQLSGQGLVEFARTRLFEPMGVTTFEWLGPADWPAGTPAAMSGLRLRARDLAKIGSLYLHGGRWRGRQLVPAAWVALSTTRHVREIGAWSRGGIWGYGYQWWIGTLPSGVEVVAAVGNGNQRLFILPSERLVVTVLAGEYNRFEGHSDRILDRVLAARPGHHGPRGPRP